MACYSSERRQSASLLHEVRMCMRARAPLDTYIVHIHMRAQSGICGHQRGVLAPCRMWVSSLSHTLLFLRNQCIRPPRTSVRGRTAAWLHMHTRDGKCSQCTNLRRSPLEKGRPALGTRRSARTYVCTCVRLPRVQERGRRAQRHASSSISGELFLSSVLLVHFAVFSLCVRAKIPRTNRFVFPCARAALTVLSNGLCTPSGEWHFFRKIQNINLYVT